MIFENNKAVSAQLHFLIKPIVNMFVYLDIVELVPMGNTQVPIMGFL